MSNVREIKRNDLPTLAEGLRAIATALDNGTLNEPPYALLVFGLRDEDSALQIMPLGRRMPGSIETVGMLTLAASSVGFGETAPPMLLPTE